nr:G-protein coupled receptor moody-like [Cherax quadricarinatus]
MDSVFTDSEESEPGRAPNWAILVTAVAAIIISIFGFFGNLLTILALPYESRLRHAATYLVVNLAVAEGIFCVTILPISAAHLFHLYVNDGDALFSDNGCNVFVFLRYVNIQAELLSIAAIAVNR